MWSNSQFKYYLYSSILENTNHLYGTIHQPEPLLWGLHVCSTLKTRYRPLHKFLLLVCLQGHRNPFQEQIPGTHPHLVQEDPLFQAYLVHLVMRQRFPHRFQSDLFSFQQRHISEVHSTCADIYIITYATLEWRNIRIISAYISVRLFIFL